MPDLEQHTLMLADSHNIFLKLKSNGTLADISSLFKRIYHAEIAFASKELKRISGQIGRSIDLGAELRNNVEIFRANLKEIVGKVIDIIWESGANGVPAEAGGLAKPRGEGGETAESSRTPKSHFFKRTQKKALKERRENSADSRRENELARTSGLAEDGRPPRELSAEVAKAVEADARAESAQELQRLRRHNLESKQARKKRFSFEFKRQTCSCSRGGAPFPSARRARGGQTRSRSTKKTLRARARKKKLCRKARRT